MMDYPVETRHSLESGTLLSATTLSSFATGLVCSQTGVIGEDLNQQLVRSLLELVNDTIVQRILVLLEPASDAVVHDTGIVSQTEVSRLAASLRWLRLQERR